MALNIKRKNKGQAPTRSNPYLNQTNIGYQKGIIMEEGGLFDINKKGYVDSVLNANKDLDWVKRLREKNAQSIKLPDQQFRSSHLMSDNGEGYVFPSIIRENGKLKYLPTEDEAIDYAKKTNTGIQLPKEQGTWFANNGYKQGTNVLKAFEQGGETQSGQLSKSDIEKKLQLEKYISYQKSLPENQGDKYSWYERNIKNPLENKGVNTNALEFGLEGASMVDGALGLSNLLKNKSLIHSEEVVRNSIKNPYTRTGENIVPLRTTSEVPEGMMPTLKEYYTPITKQEQIYNSWFKEGNHAIPDKYVPKKAIGGMVNPYKEIIPQYTPENNEDDNEDDSDSDDMNMMYSQQLSEEDIDLEKKQEELKGLEVQDIEKNKTIQQLVLAKSNMEQQLSEQQVLNKPSNKYTNKYSNDNTIGEQGKQIIGDISTALGYTPTFNSIFRDANKQAELVKKGIGVKNSFHLTGDAVDMKPADWDKLTDNEKYTLKNKYDVINHNNHYHVEPKGSPKKEDGGLIDNITPNQAREILHKKEVNGKKLTPDQYRLFGYLSKGNTLKYQVGGIYEGVDYKGLEELKKLGYKFEII